MQTMAMRTMLALGLAAGMAAAAPAMATSGFGVEASEATPANGVFTFTISNDGTQAVSDVRWHAVSGYTAQCAAQTAGGRGFTVGGVLPAGDRAVYTMRPQ